MSDIIRATVSVEARPTRQSWRPMAIVAAVTLALACVLVSPAAHASPAPKVATVSLGSTPVPLQIDFRPFVCPILDSLATGPFASFIAPFVNSLRVAFGCVST